MRAFHVLLLLTFIFCRLGGAVCVVVRFMLRLSHIFLIVSICSMIPMLLCRWCTHRILKASVSFRGSLGSGGLVGSSYLMVFAGI